MVTPEKTSPRGRRDRGMGPKGVKNTYQETDHSHGEEGKVCTPDQNQGKRGWKEQEGQNNDNHLLEIQVMFAQDILLLLVFLIDCLMVIHGVVDGCCTSYIKADDRNDKEQAIEPVELLVMVEGPEQTNQHGKNTGHLGFKFNKFKKQVTINS